MDKKWYNYFVSVEQQPGGAQEQPAPDDAAAEVAQIASSMGSRPAAAATPLPKGRAPIQGPTVAEVAGSILRSEPKFAGRVHDPASFDEVYRAAEIRQPAHGYTILKVAEMLASEHIRDLPPKVKRSSVLLALDAAGVKIEEVIQDAVSRDRALDAFERVQQKAVEELETRKTRENRQIQAELDRLIAEHKARIQANEQEVAKEQERFAAWRLKKQQEEERIAEAVSHFVLENPITTGPAPQPGPQPPVKPKGS